MLHHSLHRSRVCQTHGSLYQATLRLHRRLSAVTSPDRLVCSWQPPAWVCIPPQQHSRVLPQRTSPFQPASAMRGFLSQCSEEAQVEPLPCSSGPLQCLSMARSRLPSARGQCHTALAAPAPDHSRRRTLHGQHHSSGTLSPTKHPPIHQLFVHCCLWNLGTLWSPLQRTLPPPGTWRHSSPRSLQRECSCDCWPQHPLPAFVGLPWPDALSPGVCVRMLDHVLSLEQSSHLRVSLNTSAQACGGRTWGSTKAHHGSSTLRP